MGNKFGTIELSKHVAKLKFYVLSRRNQSQINRPNKRDHVENISPGMFTPLDNSVRNHTRTTVSLQASSSPSQPLQPTTTMTTKTTTSSGSCSEFYLACRNNDVKKVERLLEYMTLEEVDRLEPNGSTALHSASYHGHYHIVELLLKKGADRSIRNRYNYIPFDEAKNDRIKELFLRIPNSNRLVQPTGAIEWTLISQDALERAIEERNIIKIIYDEKVKTSNIEKMFEKIETNYINNILKNVGDIEKIKHYFQNAIAEEDPTWLLKAYTAETDYYRVLNTEIACGSTRGQVERRFIIALISHHERLEKYTFIGDSYRVIQMSNHDLQQYEVGCLTMTKTFVSSSIDRNIVELLSFRHEEGRKVKVEENERTAINRSHIMKWVVCKYHIKHRRTALHIEEISQYAYEGEVLIMPYSVFKVNKIENSTEVLFDDRILNVTEIQFEECDEYLET